MDLVRRRARRLPPLGANIVTSGLLDLADVPDWLRIIGAGWPALAFLGGTLLAHSPALTSQHDEPAPIRDTGPEVEPEQPARPAPVRDLTTAPELAHQETDEIAPAATAPALPVVPSVPPALVAYARKLADTHRDRHGHDANAAACTAPGCDWSADYLNRASAELAARTHRCNPR